ncbi:MAG: XRE family transcriptional regulator [Planctomycetota bacterium]|nr:XRE family transcriptional regulator [Planctomycetota bacterium]
MSDPADLGSNVRRRRLARGLTLDQLACASGVSPTMLSEVERSVKNPTVKLAYQVARALGCSLTDLLEDDGAPPPRVVRAAERRSLVDPETGIARHALSPELLRRGLEIVAYELPAGQSTGEMDPNRAGIVEHVTVQSGTLTLRLGGETFELGPDDGITYGPQVAVEYRNDGGTPCSFLLLSDSTQAFPIR